MKKQKAKKELPLELREILDVLGSKFPLSVQIEYHIDGGQVLKNVGISIDRVAEELTLGQLKQIHVKIRQWLNKPLKNQRASVRYSIPTVESAYKALLSATRAYLHGVSGKSPKKETKVWKQFIAFTTDCANTLVSFCQNGTHVSCWNFPVAYLRSACSLGNIDFNRLLSPEGLGQNFHFIQHGIKAALETAVMDGHTDDAQQIFSSLYGHKTLEKDAFEMLRNILQEKAATLDYAIQEWIMLRLGIEFEEGRVEYANPSEAPEIRQAAGLLLFIWDHAEESDTWREGLSRFRTLCERHFKLFLRGEVGNVVQYDSRLHEFTGPASSRARLVRPWVEWFNPPRAFVVIRGLVNAVENR